MLASEARKDYTAFQDPDFNAIHSLHGLVLGELQRNQVQFECYWSLYLDATGLTIIRINGFH